MKEKEISRQEFDDLKVDVKNINSIHSITDKKEMLLCKNLELI